MFSRRVPSSLEANALSRALQAARSGGRPLIDLTVTNPTAVGFTYPDNLLSGFSSTAALGYEPSPFGLRPAREAVARDYARRGVELPADRVILTSSTSEAYSLLFKLLCDPSGDDVLTPAPSYPLFEHLAGLDGVAHVPYPLEYHGRWVMDPERVQSAWTSRTRAVLAVSPNNPTGSCLSLEELDALSGICASREAALVIDEVFADYPLAAALEPPGFGVSEPPSLTFRLGGLSKSAGLPQVKLGWMAVQGPAAVVADALHRLEFICDAYLSVSTPVQVAAPSLIGRGGAIRAQIAARVRSNYDLVKKLVAGHPSIEVLRADGGWSAVIRVPSRMPEEEIVLTLLERDGVIVHPGFFFDFAHEAFLVVSLLPPPDAFGQGVERLLARVG
jgi:aspartate/methionine/tyrosine aminotransferase